MTNKEATRKTINDYQAYLAKKSRYVAKDMDYMSRLSAALGKYSCPEKVECETTRTLLRLLPPDRLFSPLDWEIFYGYPRDTAMPLPIAAERLEEILYSPCPFDRIREDRVRNNHFLFSIPNRKEFTLEKWSKLHPDDDYPCGVSGSCHGDGDYFRKTHPRFSWYLMYLRMVPNSPSWSWERQQAYLPEGYMVPLACELTALHCLYNTKNRAAIESLPPYYGCTITDGRHCNVPDTTIIASEHKHIREFEAAIFPTRILDKTYRVSFAYSHVDSRRDNRNRHGVFAFRKL